VLQNYSLQDLCEKRDSRKQLDIMYYIWRHKNLSCGLLKILRSWWDGHL
jgi:hypothetical protein